MSTPGGVVAGLLGSAASEAAGFAAGVAIGPTMRPVVQFLENEAWKAQPDRPPTIYTVVQGVAQGQIAEAPAREWAHEQGFNDAVFDALKAAANSGPAFGELLNAYRRGLLDQGGFQTGLNRLAIEPQWWTALRGLARTHLSPAEAANARQQQFITRDQQLQTAGLYGVVPADAEVQFELAGLPPGVETGLEMWRRGIIGQAEFAQIVAEGHTKTKYTAELEQLRRQLLSAALAVRAHLKGHIDAAEMHNRGAEWGYSPADMDLWYQAEGRPATTHQIHIGYARGSDVQGLSEQEAIKQAVAQSDVRPEYGPVLYAGRYTLPTPFVMRTLTQSGVWSEAKAAQRLKEAGWIPADADEAAAAWAGGGAGPSADPHLQKADSQVWTTLHKAYLGSVVDAATVAQGFHPLGIQTAARQPILDRWTFERELERKRLTPAQVKKALGESVLNPATGATWTQNDALAYLIELGYSTADARTFLEI